MSHIFEALQKSESDRRGVSSPSSRATEFLERMEAQALSQWQSAGADPEIAELAATEPARAAWPAQPGTAAAAAESRPEMPANLPELQLSLGGDKRLAVLADSESPAAEAFRLLAVRLRHLQRDRKFRRVLITSTIPQEGKSLVSANLACALAAGGRQRVLLIEGDLRRPSLSKMFGVKPPTGLIGCLKGEQDLAGCVYAVEKAGLWILPAGGSTNGALELLQSGRVPAMMERLSAWFDWVIIDSPPVLPLADTSLWMRMAEGILLVARPGTTEKKQLKRGLESIEPEKLLGAVLNSACEVDDARYYYYGRREEAEPEAAAAR